MSDGDPRAPRLEDAERFGGGPSSPDPAALAGVWINTCATPRGPSALEIEAADGGLAIRSRGPRGGSPVAWGQATVYGGIATPAPLAFSARRAFEDGGGLLQGNLNLGLLVLGTYRRFDDGRPGRFAREFFARTDSPLPPAGGGPDEALFADAEPAAEADPEPALGRWRNADDATRGIAEIHLERRDGGLGIRVLGTGSGAAVDWGWTAPGVYAAVDEAGARTVSLLAAYELGPLSIELQLRVPGGVLALAAFNAFRDGGGSSYFTREFFYRP